jgi:hypothetical protein
MRLQLADLLHKLSEGSVMVLRFPSSGEMEKFRQSLYREKKDLDNLRLMTEEDFVPRSLRFRKLENLEVELSFYTPKLVDFQFEIVSELGEPDG